MFRRILRIALGAAVVVLIGAQFFQPKRTNPVSDPSSSYHVVARPPVEVTSILSRSCHDYHSNETVWPLYGKIAPVSWLIARDVQEGRAHLNFSEWGRSSRTAELCEQVRGGEMPFWHYRLLHPTARLAPTEITTLCSQFPERRED